MLTTIIKGTLETGFSKLGEMVSYIFFMPKDID